MSNNFNASKLLPKKWLITSAGTHFYRIGLSAFKMTNYKRPVIYTPFYIFIIMLLQLIRSRVSIVLPEKSYSFYLFLGDFTHFMGIRIQCQIALGLIMLQCILSQLVYFYNYMKGIRPTNLGIFHVMSGLITPQSIGLTDITVLRKLILTFKRYIWLTEKYIIFIPIQGFMVVFIGFYNKLSTIHLFIYGLPHTIIYDIIDCIGYQMIIWQFVYFYLIVYYLNSKLILINNEQILRF